MRLGKIHLLALLLPAAALFVAAAWWIGMGLVKPGADISERGHEELLYSALWAGVIGLVAVPAAAFRMWRTPALRTGGNIAATVVGSLPIPVAALIWLALLVAL